VRRYINDIEPLFIEYASAFLSHAASDGWQLQVAELTEKALGRQVPAALRGRHPRAIALLQYLQASDHYDPVLDGLMSAFKYDRTYFDKIVSSVGPLLEKLTSGTIAALLSPNLDDDGDQRPVLEWMHVIRNRGIVYVGLDALSDTTVASAVGNSMFADLVSVAGHIYKHGVADSGGAVPIVSLHADEFNELIGEEFVPLLNKAGGAGFQVTAYTQTWSDVEARLGDRAKAGQVAGNFNTLVMLRVKELATARMLTDQLK
jgi:conjugative coupling factor TraD (SXT/TOL subfamily)